VKQKLILPAVFLIDKYVLSICAVEINKTNYQRVNTLSAEIKAH